MDEIGGNLKDPPLLAFELPMTCGPSVAVYNSKLCTFQHCGGFLSDRLCRLKDVFKLLISPPQALSKVSLEQATYCLGMREDDIIPLFLILKKHKQKNKKTHRVSIQTFYAMVFQVLETTVSPTRFFRARDVSNRSSQFSRA